MPRVTGLFLYPVKSLRGHAVPAAELDALGFVGDRRFLVVDATGKFLTQRTAPRMALIATELTNESLILTAPNHGSVTVGRALRQTVGDKPQPTLIVSIWKDTVVADDCGAVAAVWLSDFLGITCHLVRVGREFSRPILKSAAQPGDLFTFADACPFLIISEASLAHLNDRIQANQGEPVPMNRFRPNFVIDGCDAFAEDTWSRFKIGDGIFRSAGKSVRCIITTTDQLTGERGKEPLKTLATFRRNPADPTEIFYGVNLIHETKHGAIRVGDEVVLIP